MLQSHLSCLTWALLLASGLATPAVAASSGFASSDFGCPAPKASQPAAGRPLKCPTVTPIHIATAPAAQTAPTQQTYVYCSPMAATAAASGASGTPPVMPVKVLEECKKEAGPVITKIDVRLTKDLAVKLESGNPAISYIGTIAAIGLLGAVLYIGYKATKKTSNSESASGLAVLVLFLAVGVGALLGYWLKGDARTMLNEVQVKDLVTSAEFQAALANSTRTTEEASRLQLRVADLERELSLARTGPRSPAPDSSIPILNALVYLGFGAILGTLLTGGVPLRRGRSALELNNALQSIRNVLNRPPASISPDPSSTNWEQHAIVAVQGILDAVLDMKSNSGSKSHAS